MILLQLKGGLGNQLFQYAAGRRLADRLGLPLRLDLSAYARDRLRRCELGAFRVRARPSWHHRAPDLPAWLPDRTRPLLRRWRARLLYGRYRRVQEPLDQRFLPALLEQPGTRLLLQGYWQDERYFADRAPAIRADLVPRGPLSADARAREREILAAATPVAVHVRRGDYTRPGTQAFHGLCDLAYYERAAGLLRERCPDACFFVFTDDPPWAADHLRLHGAVRLPPAAPRLAAWEDLILMSRCQHFITANSSFSWWGAWLGTAADKTVVAPRQWLRDPRIDLSGICPPAWVRL